MDASHRQDIAYRIIASPVGSLLLASTSKGLARVAFETENHARVLNELAQEFGGEVSAQPERLSAAKQEFDEYFAGARTTFDLPFDLRGAEGFRRAVLDQLAAIEYGATVSYGEIAAKIGDPRMAREVGEACASNPLPIVIPCHRVVRTGGGLGGYLSGYKTKRALLDLEAARRRLSFGLVFENVA